MTTFELPPEPPIGSQLRDPDQHVWERTHDGWTGINYAGRFPWSWIMARSPLTLIEPDPWPTEDKRLIAATPNPDDGTPGRWLMYRSNDGTYWDTEGAQFDPEQGDTLTNVVPVTVVPTAEWEALVETMRQWDDGGFAPITSTVRAIIAATAALGLDQ